MAWACQWRILRMLCIRIGIRCDDGCTCFGIFEVMRYAHCVYMDWVGVWIMVWRNRVDASWETFLTTLKRMLDQA
jgi:hypothetical protein